MDWRFDRRALEQRETVRRLLQLRGEHPQLRCPHFLRPADAEALDAGQLAWFGADGRGLSHEDWMDPSRHLLVMLRPAIPGREGSEHLLIVFSAEAEPAELTLPSHPWPVGRTRLLFDSALESQDDLPDAPVRSGSVHVQPGSVGVVGVAPESGLACGPSPLDRRQERPCQSPSDPPDSRPGSDGSRSWLSHRSSTAAGSPPRACRASTWSYRPTPSGRAMTRWASRPCSPTPRVVSNACA